MRTRGWSLSGQEKQSFKGFDLNLQSHTHNWLPKAPQLMFHSVCPQLVTRSKAGLTVIQWKGWERLWTATMTEGPALPMVLCGIHLLPPVHSGGVEVWTAPMSTCLEFLADPAEKREKNPSWPPCHHITSLSQALLGPDQVGKWATETGSPQWEFSAAPRFDSVQGLVIPFHQHSCSTLLFLPSPPLHLPWERLFFL